jgi:hypothetical protein
MNDENETGTTGRTLWLTDQEGNNYVVHSEVIQAFRVPEEDKTEVQDYFQSDVQGYGDAKFLLNGVLDHMGTKLGMKGYDATFDLDQDGDTDWADYAIAKKHWQEQYGNPSLTSASKAKTSFSSKH